MQNLKVEPHHVTIDDIEFAQLRFQDLLATHGELILIDKGIAVARILLPIK